MNHEPVSVDIAAFPELIRLAQDAAERGRPLLLRASGIDLAILTPAHTHDRRSVVVSQRSRAGRATRRPARAVSRVKGMSVTDRTAGILKQYAKTPPPTPEEEKDAFEQAVSDQVIASMGS